MGRAETNSEAVAESVRRITGTAFEGRREADFFGGGTGAAAAAATGVGAFARAGCGTILLEEGVEEEATGFAGEGFTSGAG